MESMSELTNRIDTLLTQRGILRAELCKTTGVPDSTIRGWIKGVKPNVESVVKVADYFGVSVGWLITGQGDEPRPAIEQLPYQEKRLIEQFRELDTRDKNTVLTLVNSLLTQYSNTKGGNITAV